LVAGDIIEHQPLGVFTGVVPPVPLDGPFQGGPQPKPGPPKKPSLGFCGINGEQTSFMVA
jgi:hypothetical protein